MVKRRDDEAYFIPEAAAATLPLPPGPVAPEGDGFIPDPGAEEEADGFIPDASDQPQDRLSFLRTLAEGLHSGFEVVKEVAPLARAAVNPMEFVTNTAAVNRARQTVDQDVQALRDQRAAALEVTEEQILAEAERTGKVPRAKLAGYAAYNLTAPAVVPTPSEAAIGAVTGIGLKAAEPILQRYALAGATKLQGAAYKTVKTILEKFPSLKAKYPQLASQVADTIAAGAKKLVGPTEGEAVSAALGARNEGRLAAERASLARQRRGQPPAQETLAPLMDPYSEVVTTKELETFLASRGRHPGATPAPAAVPKELVGQRAKIRTRAGQEVEGQVTRTVGPYVEVLGPDGRRVTGTLAGGSVPPSQPGLPGASGAPRPDLTSPKLNVEHSDGVAARAAEIAQMDPNSPLAKETSKRLFLRVADLLEAEVINPDELPSVLGGLKEKGLTPTDFAKLYREAYSYAGKTLNRLSRVAKVINDTLPPEARKLLEGVREVQATIWEQVKDVYKKVDNVRRAALVSQPATAIRNVISQGGTYTLAAVEDALVGAAQVARGAKPADAFVNAFQDLAAVGRAMTRGGRERLAQILDSDILTKTDLLRSPVQDVALGQKVSRVLNWANSLQETFYRKMAFDARLTANMAKAGLDPANVKDLPEALVKDAVDHALKLTFAKRPDKGTFGAAVMKVYQEIPFLTALGNPFPLFWTNAMKFLVDHSPGGYVRLLGPEFRSALASGDRKAMEAMAKATTGSLLFGAGYALRESPFAGEKWYEIKLPNGKRIDARPFAPFSTYLFIGEAIREAQGKETALTGFDWAEAAISINRIAGSGLAVVDMIRDKDSSKTIDRLKQIVGQYAGGFTVPAKGYLRDPISAVVPEERIARTTQGSPLTGPAVANLPFAQRLLPPSASPTRSSPIEREDVLQRQLTGVAGRTKNPVEIEVDRLGISFQDMAPRTGDQESDREVMTIMGPIVEKTLSKFVQSRAYQNLDDEMKREELREQIAKIRKLASAQVTNQAKFKEIKATKRLAGLSREQKKQRVKDVIDKYRKPRLP